MLHPLEIQTPTNATPTQIQKPKTTRNPTSTLSYTTWLPRRLPTFDAALLPPALTIRCEARDTWLTLSAGRTGSSNFDRDDCFDARDPAFECLEWCECVERPVWLPIWLIESSGVTCESTSRSTTLSGRGTSRAETYDLPPWLPFAE